MLQQDFSRHGGSMSEHGHEHSASGLMALLQRAHAVRATGLYFSRMPDDRDVPAAAEAGPPVKQRG
jgi:hypothetical protein